jgi:hypothetical protein
MNIKIRNSKNDVRFSGDEIISRKDIILEEIYQNSPEIANILMQTDAYKLFGCRVTGFFRCVKNELKNKDIPNTLTMKMFDTLLDKIMNGSSAWTGKISDIMNGQIATDRINGLYKTELKYNYLNNLSVIQAKQLIDNNHAITIKMPSLVSGDHYINICGYVVTKNNGIFFKQKDTYSNTATYNGYNDYQDIKSNCYEYLI